MYFDTGCIDSIVAADSSAAAQVGTQPVDSVAIHTCVQQVFEESTVVHCVKSFREVDCHCYCASWKAAVVETSGDLKAQRSKSSGGRSPSSEAVLGVGEMNMGCDKLEHQPL